MSADQDVANNFNGVDGGGQSLSWAQSRLRMRTTLTNILQKVPFLNQFSRWDQITTTSEQITWRYVDVDGLVWDKKSTDLIWIEWLKDGAPTGLTPNAMAQKIAVYRKNADTLRAWPTTEVISGKPYTGILPGDPTQAYPSYPPAAK